MDLTGSIVGFARTLRAAGVDASPDRVHAFVVALDQLTAVERSRVYWAGRLTLCSGRDDLERYDRVFAAYFDDARVAVRPKGGQQVRVLAEGLATGSAPPSRPDADLPEVDAVLRKASAVDALRHRDIASLDPSERTELNRLLAAFHLPGEPRRTRRRSSARRGAVDRRRTVRRLLAAGGEPGALLYDAPRQRPRRAVLLVDVSGSMAGYADALLRFAHAAARRRTGRTEVFTLGTRLTQITDEMAHRDPDTAMHAVSAAIPDWEGGTRLGITLREFLDRFGQRGMARGAVVVVLSDGWETGDVTLLAGQMARLGRLAHRIVWANPRAGQPGFAPSAAGMAAALPHCDQLVEGHSLAALERLAGVVAGVATDPATERARRDRDRAMAGAASANR